MLIYHQWILYIQLFFIGLTTSVPIYASENVINQGAFNLTDWMSCLPKSSTEVPISALAIPGSHDSGSYSITNQSEFSPDLEYAILIWFFPDILKPFAAVWTVTQSANFSEQLSSGIRYFDLRVATRYQNACRKENNEDPINKFYLVHGQYANRLIDELLEIREYLHAHTKEIVILDFQHFYEFQNYDMVQFRQIIFQIFNTSLVPYDLIPPTLSDLWRIGKQVLVFSKSRNEEFGSHFWPRSRISQPWANTNEPEHLLNFLNKHYRPKTRSNETFYVYQAVLTPNIDNIIFGKDFNMTHLAKQANYILSHWLEEKKRVIGPGGITIVISDFSTWKSHNISQKIIQLNWNLDEANFSN